MLFTETPQGKEIKLTIDSDFQYFVESEMARAIKEYDAAGGWVVILDAKTSAIRALASLPSFDPNTPQNASAFVRRNRAVTDSFEPGSTLKTFVIADALDNKVIKPSTKIFCENCRFRIGKRIVREAEKSHAQGTISVSEILAYSSNIGTAKIALMRGDDRLKAGLLAFGFGEKSGVELPGEAKGITVRLPWNDHLLANISFGQGITATPLQLANAFAVIANGGVLNKPYIIEHIKDVETGESTETKVQQIRRVISEDTAAKMRVMLAAATTDKGTGIEARVKGYFVAGKTGTAQKIKTESKGYMKGAYIASFGGFIPANDPKYVIFIGIDHPKKNSYYGSVVAAPLFAKIASYAVRKSGVNPEIPTETNLAKTLIPANKKTDIEDKTINIGSEITDEVIGKSLAELTEVVPYLKTLSLREVINIASEEKINVKFVGSGKVEFTYPEQGQPLNENREVTVILR
ncbi:MAG: penicillin-binding transpeptidase domain-containing protein [Bdellovibrionota bacterium]